jgi:hypothetical protein
LTHPRLVSVHGLERAAVMAAEYIATRLDGAGTILMIGAADDHSLTARLRVQGFHGVTARYPGISAVCTWVTAGATRPPISSCYTRPISGRRSLPGPHRLHCLAFPIRWRWQGRDACRKLGDHRRDKTIVVGINGDPLAIAAIEAGTMAATVETSPQDLGYKFAEYAYRAARWRGASQSLFLYASIW